jgi:hypothetical protein
MIKTEMKMKNTEVQVVALIRKEIKEKFPNLKTVIKHKSIDDVVFVNLTDATKLEHREVIKLVTNKYQISYVLVSNN